MTQHSKAVLLKFLYSEIDSCKRSSASDRLFITKSAELYETEVRLEECRQKEAEPRAFAVPVGRKVTSPRTQASPRTATPQVSARASRAEHFSLPVADVHYISPRLQG